MLFYNLAYAEEAASKNPHILEQLIPFFLLFLIFYFIFIRPQKKRQQQQRKFWSHLKKGDNVLTTGGVFGRIEGLTDQFVTLEVSQGIRIRVLRSRIESYFKEEVILEKKKK